jgi:hypothetical protein
VISILRHTIPPHKDNEHAAAVLVNYHSADTHSTDTSKIEWVIIRPDMLIDNAEVTAYNLESSPIRNVIFDAGQTSRINVANFMTRLLLENDLWQRWQGKMPVIYNTTID